VICEFGYNNYNQLLPIIGRKWCNRENSVQLSSQVAMLCLVLFVH